VRRGCRSHDSWLGFSIFGQAAKEGTADRSSSMASEDRGRSRKKAAGWIPTIEGTDLRLGRGGVQSAVRLGPCGKAGEGDKHASARLLISGVMRYRLTGGVPGRRSRFSIFPERVGHQPGPFWSRRGCAPLGIEKIRDEGEATAVLRSPATFPGNCRRGELVGPRKARQRFWTKAVPVRRSRGREW